jgi:hypothetical protein
MEDQSILNPNGSTDSPKATISEGLQNFIESMVEEIVLEGRPFDTQKKYLKKYSENEGLDYDKLEADITTFIEILDSLKTAFSKLQVKLAEEKGRDCYISEETVKKLVSHSSPKEQLEEEKQKPKKDEPIVAKPPIWRYLLLGVLLLLLVVLIIFFWRSNNLKPSPNPVIKHDTVKIVQNDTVERIVVQLDTVVDLRYDTVRVVQYDTVERLRIQLDTVERIRVEHDTVVVKYGTEGEQQYRAAAEEGDKVAQFGLACCYAGGTKGLSQNYEEAVKWYRKSADQGYDKAQNNLGHCYEQGHGVPQNYAEAKKWYKKAADQGNSRAKNNLERLKKQEEEEQKAAQAQAEAEKKEEAAYKKCTTIAACDSYLKTYPKGRYLTEVRAKKTKLEEQARTEAVAKAKAEQEAEAKAQAQAEAEKKEEAAYKRCTTIAACDSYLKTYPQGTYADEVRKKRDELTKAEAIKTLGCVTGQYNGHDYVDLGLPSGTLWATCNVGANKPYGYGNYYAWGEVTPKELYEWNNYKYACGDHKKLTKYCNKSEYGQNDFTDNLIVLQPADDAASSSWGNGWRLPTIAQWKELMQNTTSDAITQNGVRGKLFVGPNGNSMFLPAAGYYDSGKQCSVSFGYYWSNSICSDYPYRSWGFWFNLYPKGFGVDHESRDYGKLVRAVRSSY